MQSTSHGGGPADNDQGEPASGDPNTGSAGAEAPTETTDAAQPSETQSPAAVSGDEPTDDAA